MWELPGDSHAVAIQWVCMVKDPPATILDVHSCNIITNMSISRETCGLKDHMCNYLASLTASRNHCMIACMSCVHHMGGISFTTSTVSLKNGSIMGHRLNYCAFLRLV